MIKKTSKTLYYMKIMVCKLPPGGGYGTLPGHWPKMIFRLRRGQKMEILTFKTCSISMFFVSIAYTAGF